MGSARERRGRYVEQLIETDAASMTRTSCSKWASPLREAKEFRAELAKIRMGRLDNHAVTDGAISNPKQASSHHLRVIILNMKKTPRTRGIRET